MNIPAPPGIEVQEHVSLARHTYMRIGGNARFFAVPRDLAELELLMMWARSWRMGFRVLGGGSNLLVADEGMDAVVVSLRQVAGGIIFEGSQAAAGAAVMLPALARAAAERGLGGLEFAVGIPGSVGGALQSNAGIGDGRDIGKLVETVDVFGAHGMQTLSKYEVRFDYRHSSLRGSGVMALGATLNLTPRPREEIEADMRRLLEARAASQPTAQPNAGSIFRNPPGDFAGRLIEAAGCKGLAVGGAQVSEKHANFIVHDGTGTAAQVAELMAEVQRRVLEQSGVWLQPEIEWWGDGLRPLAFRSGPDAVDDPMDEDEDEDEP